MKPLELTIHPPVPPKSGPADPEWIPRDWLQWNAARKQEQQAAEAKRLTEPELCAEFEAARCDAMIQSATGRCWQQLGFTWPMDDESIRSRAQTLLRFASSPHYFEEAP